jgi:hypothetical protein
MHPAASLSAQHSAAQFPSPVDQKSIVSLDPYRPWMLTLDDQDRRDLRTEDSDRSLIEARYEATHGQPIVNISPLVQYQGSAPLSLEKTGTKAVRPKRASLSASGSLPVSDNLTASGSPSASGSLPVSGGMRVRGIKKRKKGKKGEEDGPPTPRGCQWLKTDNGWNLWRYWTERDPLTGEKIRKTRYAGFLSQEAWEIMKDYDYETFISIIGQRLRRYGQR